ncbi:Protein of unknown function [Ectothiorhodospira mobilis]|uniref:DUF2939 domain-containing protein n=1 Tax=Ectothiorhodospira mobilis TaxID=195064 RepID=A0A1I4PFU9_ECTMO|nr:DUF2939 domain-containing protein [Ectothiorhodospira mobilis]SFM26465.1 Protein of unknown function [Ectothiorhodospira mobilis]
MKHLVKPLLLLSLLALAGWMFYSPYHAVDRIREAAQAEDTETMARYTDLPALRADVRQALRASMEQEWTEAAGDHPFAAMGLALADALLQPLVDAMVSPEVLTRIWQGYLPRTPAQDEDELAMKRRENTRVDLGYEAYDRFVVTIAGRDTPEDKVQLVFTRRNLIFWKLTGLRLPL